VLTEENALWCLYVLAALGAALGVIWHLGRNTFYNGGAR
jgi:hypothetical protein